MTKHPGEKICSLINYTSINLYFIIIGIITIANQFLPDTFQHVNDFWWQLRLIDINLEKHIIQMFNPLTPTAPETARKKWYSIKKSLLLK